MASIKFSSLETKMHYVMEGVNEIRFVPHSISSTLYAKCAFSDVKFDLRAHLSKKKTARISFLLQNLFHVELSEAHRPALEFIYRCRKVFWADDDLPTRESTVALKICSQVLQHICGPGEVVLEKDTYKQLLSKKPINGVHVGTIGLGSTKTWHGTPDVRVRGTNIVVSGMEMEEDETEDEEERKVEEDSDSDGMTVLLEVKSSMRAAHMPQAISICITSSFIENNLHEDMDPTVPTILIDGSKFRVILYNCVEDVLLISETKDLRTGDRLSSTGVAFLWIVINHRLFFRKLPKSCRNYPANFKDMATSSLSDFKALCDKNLHWPKERIPYRIEYSEFPLTDESDSTPPPLKKSKKV